MPYPCPRVVVPRRSSLRVCFVVLVYSAQPVHRHSRGWSFLHMLRHSANSTSTASSTSEAVRAVMAVLTLVSANLPVDVLKLKLVFVAFAQRARETDVLSG